MLVGWTPAPMSARELLAASMSVAATALYGYTIVFTKVKLKGASPMGTAAGTLLMAAAAMLPFTPVTRDLSTVPWMAWLAVLELVPELKLATAFVKDPWGTSIELTEGLRDLP